MNSKDAEYFFGRVPWYSLLFHAYLYERAICLTGCRSKASRASNRRAAMAVSCGNINKWNKQPSPGGSGDDGGGRPSLPIDISPPPSPLQMFANSICYQLRRRQCLGDGYRVCL